jgi:DNA-directed RNA polymerase specialized sigma24 family protein
MGRVDVKYWLRGILRNKVVDYIRKASREGQLKTCLEQNWAAEED